MTGIGETRTDLSFLDERIASTQTFGKAVVDGNKQLRNNLPGLLETARMYPVSPFLHELVIRECIPPSGPVIGEIIESSELFAVPVSAVGLTTEYETGLRNACMLLTGSDPVYSGRAKKGLYMSPSYFREGVARTTGFWVVQSLPAAEAVERNMKPAEENSPVVYEVQGRAVADTPEDTTVLRAQYEAASRHIKPTDQDVVYMARSAAHEGFQAFYSYMRLDYPLNTGFAYELLSETLAYREQIRRGVYTPDFVVSLMLKHYFSNSNPSPQTEKAIRDCIGVATTSFDPDYQAEISWRGIVVPTVGEFISPSDEVREQSNELAQKAKKVVVPQFVEQLKQTF